MDMPMKQLRHILRTLGLARYVAHVKVHPDGMLSLALKSPIPKENLRALREHYWVSADRRVVLIDKHKAPSKP